MTLPGEHQGEPVSLLSASLVVTSLIVEDGVVETIPAGVIGGAVFTSSSDASQNRKKITATVCGCRIPDSANWLNLTNFKTQIGKNTIACWSFCNLF